MGDLLGSPRVAPLSFLVGLIAYGGPARSPCVHPSLFLRTSFVGHLVYVGEARSLRSRLGQPQAGNDLVFGAEASRRARNPRKAPRVAPLWC